MYNLFDHYAHFTNDVDVDDVLAGRDLITTDKRRRKGGVKGRGRREPAV